MRQGLLEVSRQLRIQLHCQCIPWPIRLSVRLSVILTVIYDNAWWRSERNCSDTKDTHTIGWEPEPTWTQWVRKREHIECTVVHCNIPLGYFNLQPDSYRSTQTMRNLLKFLYFSVFSVSSLSFCCHNCKVATFTTFIGHGWGTDGLGRRRWRWRWWQSVRQSEAVPWADTTKSRWLSLDWSSMWGGHRRRSEPSAATRLEVESGAAQCAAHCAYSSNG